MSLQKPVKRAPRRFNSETEAILAGWPDALDGTPLSVPNYNLLAVFATAMLRADPLRDQREVRTASISAFRAQCLVVDGSWIVNPSYTLRGSGLVIQNKYAPQEAIEEAH